TTPYPPKDISSATRVLASRLHLVTAQPLRIFEKLAPSLSVLQPGSGSCDSDDAAQEFFLPASSRRNLMFKQNLSLALIGSLLFMLISAPTVTAKPKTEKEAARAAEVKAGVAKLGVGPEAQIIVTLRDKTKLSGYISQATADSLVITDPNTGASTEVPSPTATQATGKNLPTAATTATP